MSASSVVRYEAAVAAGREPDECDMPAEFDPYWQHRCVSLIEQNRQLRADLQRAIPLIKVEAIVAHSDVLYDVMDSLVAALRRAAP